MATPRFTTHAGQVPGRMPRAALRDDSTHGGQPVTTAKGEPGIGSQFRVYTRGGLARIEVPFEKPVVLAGLDNYQHRDLLWADARFATDILAEHAMFFALLMPPEIAPEQRAAALAFQSQFTKLRERLALEGPPPASEMRQYVADLRTAIQPLIEFKRDNHRAQVTGELRTLVWPTFFDHTRREAERWLLRMEDIAAGNDLDRKEVVRFWCDIMDEHARFVAHLLDPEELELVQKATRTSQVFRDLNHPGTGVLRAIVRHPGTVAKSLFNNPEMDAVMSAAETILDFKTETARGIEAAKIRSIIDPRLADHVRREAVKFVDELRRCAMA